MPAIETLRRGAPPDDVAIPANRNLQSGHPGPHALDCIHDAPVEPPHAADPPRLARVTDVGSAASNSTVPGPRH